ncbi:MAG: phytanoyl-CoA dioxygenase family protein [Chitinophagales bacterium]|nr:phytanoyl-CoA dioxygenase family protein [Chitinophagales bacterium]
MKTIFKDQEKQQFFEREGYVTFPLLNKEEVAELYALYASLNLETSKRAGFHVVMDNSNKEMVRQVRNKIWEVALPRFNEHLQNYKSHVATFAIKEVSDTGITPPHMDWSFAENEQDGYFSTSCWIALMDMNAENGCMSVVRGGSHHIFKNYRPSPSPQIKVPLDNLIFDIFPYTKIIEMKAGEVLIFDNRTFHASPPNTSNTARVAAGVAITQKDANLVHYYLKPDGTEKTVLKYNIDEEFFMKYSNADLSKLYDEGKLIEGYGTPTELPYEFVKYTPSEMVDMLKAAGNVYDDVLANRLATLFGFNKN